MVTYPEGLSETYTYGASGKLSKITENGVGGAASRDWLYTWSGNDLTRIDRPDGTAYEFIYGDAAHPGYMTRMDLVAIGGVSHRVEAAWEYDVQGNVVRTWKGDVSATGTNAVERYSFSFDNASQPAVTTMTDQLGKADRTPPTPTATRRTRSCPPCGWTATARARPIFMIPRGISPRAPTPWGPPWSGPRRGSTPRPSRPW